MTDSRNLRDRLTPGQPPVLLDGPVGSELHRRGVDTRLPLWSATALLDDVDVLEHVHADYVRAGAEIHSACTFRTNPRTLERAGLKGQGPELVKRAVSAARRACDNQGDGADLARWVVGVLAPVEDCYRSELVPDRDSLLEEHRRHAKWQVHAGVDGFLVETMNTALEAEAALLAARETGLPSLVSLVPGSGGTLLSGEPLVEGVARLAAQTPDAILVNCSETGTITEAHRLLRTVWTGPSGAYANTGKEDPDVGWSAGSLGVREYADAAGSWLDAGARIVGSCCGTTPEHIRALRGLIDDWVEGQALQGPAQE